MALSRGLRYDHFSVLCELLPVGIPSLAVCLQSLLHGTVPCSSQAAGGQAARSRAPDAPDGTSLKLDVGLAHQASLSRGPLTTSVCIWLQEVLLKMLKQKWRTFSGFPT